MHFVVTFIHELNPTYYASIMLDAFNNLLCLKLCCHNRPGPIGYLNAISSFKIAKDGLKPSS